jgi:hypothetical protein
VERLGLYVAGPLAAASLGLGLLSASTYAASVIWTLAFAWTILALKAWNAQRLDLVQRTIRLANRIQQCGAEGRNAVRWRPMSPYGPQVSAALHLRDLQERKHRWWCKRRRRFTRRMHEELIRILNEWGHQGQIRHRLDPFFSTPPSSDEEYELVGTQVAWLTVPEA